MLRRPLIPFLLCFMGGIFLGHTVIPHGLWPFSFSSLLFVVFLISIFLLPSFRRPPFFLVLFFLAGVPLDLARHQRSELMDLASERPQVLIEGVLLEPVTRFEDMARMTVRVDHFTHVGKRIHSSENIQVTIYRNAAAFTAGDNLLFPARLRPFMNFNNPGRYNYELAMDVKGLSCAASVSDGRRVVPMGKGDLGFPFQTLETMRKPVRDFFEENLTPQNRAIFEALVLGERQNLTRELRETFNASGLSHVLAVSGLHIALVAWLCYTILKSLLSLSTTLILRTDIRKVAALLTCFPVIVYTGLTGFQVSAERAMIMGLAYLFSMVLGREKEMWSTLSLAALAVLALDPHALFSVSAQLSFLAVVGILWLAPIIYKKLSFSVDQQIIKSQALNRFYVYVIGLMATTISATLVLLPITTFYFHRIPLLTIPANMALVPVLGLFLLSLGLSSALLLTVSSSLACVLLQVGAWVLDRVMETLQFWTRFDWAAFWGITPNGFEILLFYGLLLALFFVRRFAWAKLGLVAVICLIGGDIVFWIYRTNYNPHLRVTYLDVGQGNAALVEFPGGQRMLVDGGGSPGDDFDVGEMVVAPFLFYSKIRRIDYLVLTHPQTDHMEGLRFIASHFRPKEFWYNGEKPEHPEFLALLRVINEKNIKPMTPLDLKEGRNIAGVTTSVLHPVAEDESGTRRKALKSNDQSLVLKISEGDKAFLFPGDLEATGEVAVVHSAGTHLKSEVLLAPHHGSKSSCSKAFLEMVAPRFCIISTRGGNPFGFPNPEMLRRLQEAQCKILRIDRMGAIEVSVDSGGLQVRGFLE